MPHKDVLEVAYSPRAQVGPIAAFGGLAVAGVVAASLGVLPSWTAAILVAMALVVVAVGSVVAWKCARVGTVLRLDAGGIAVRHERTVLWSEIAEIQTGPLRPTLLYGSRHRILSVIGRPGVVLPGPPGYGRAPTQRGSAMRLKMYGTNLIMLPHAMTATVEEIAQAAVRWGSVPVRHLPVPAWWKRLALVIGTGVALGVVGSIVVAIIELT